jgi:hypothetical protein
MRLSAPIFDQNDFSDVVLAHHPCRFAYFHSAQDGYYLAVADLVDSHHGLCVSVNN